MAHKREQRVIDVDCPQCTGRGFVATKNGYRTCTYPGCSDGQVQRIVNEIVAVDDKVETK